MNSDLRPQLSNTASSGLPNAQSEPELQKGKAFQRSVSPSDAAESSMISVGFISFQGTETIIKVNHRTTVEQAVKAFKDVWTVDPPSNIYVRLLSQEKLCDPRDDSIKNLSIGDEAIKSHKNYRSDKSIYFVTMSESDFMSLGQNNPERSRPFKN